MSFNSFQFIFLFLPIFLATYYIWPSKSRNWLLSFGSLLFYIIGSWTRPLSILLFAISILLTWLVGLGLELVTKKKSLLIRCVSLLFAILAFGKYAGHFNLELSLPLGISFYTFQMTAYLVDVYRGQIPAEKSLLNYAAGIVMFPKLLSGPLVDSKSLFRQVQNRKYSLASFDQGLRQFILGLALKVLLADRVGAFWKQTQSIGFESISTPMAWLGILSFSLKIYFDFCGYSWMAMGVGRMLGFQLPLNFNAPYVAKSMSEFWRRWHITLGAWFRKYVYIPLGGNRRGRLRQIFNLLVVWLFTGLWHGSTLNFLLWGLFLFFLIANEKLWLGRVLERCPLLARVYMLFVIPFSWLLFALEDVSAIAVYFTRLLPFFGGGIAVNPLDFLPYLQKFGLFLLVGLLLCGEKPRQIWQKYYKSPVGTIVCFILFWLSVYFMAVAANDPFMYFSF